jgi:alpha-tubulin suppressor-like RCC1 family protein
MQNVEYASSLPYSLARIRKTFRLAKISTDHLIPTTNSRRSGTIIMRTHPLLLICGLLALFGATVQSARALPSITAEPQSQSVTEGTNITFTVVASGEGTLSYQWAHDETNLSPDLRISGTTTSSLTISNVMGSDAGFYGVAVTDTNGTTLSTNVLLIVNLKPVISSIPDQRTFPGTATRSVAFTIGDNESDVSNLILSAASSNTNLVPTQNIVLGGTGSNRTVTVTPAANLQSNVNITISVQDEQGAKANSSFQLRVATFTRTNINTFVGAELGATAWGDYDNDGYLDLIISGMDEASNPVTRLYRNLGNGTFTNVPTSLPDLRYTTLAWGDYDNDGDLDLAISGENSSFQSMLGIYRNNGGTFTLSESVSNSYPPVSVAWGDYNQDGKQDLLVGGAPTYIYKNTGTNLLSHIAAVFRSVFYGSATFADYDNDGYQDVLAVGSDSNNIRESHLFRNNGKGGFSEVSTTLPGVDNFCIWGDYNGDGLPDLMLAGYSSLSNYIARIYRNDGAGSFTQLTNSLAQSDGAAAWGDFDGDGKLDFVITDDNTASGRVSRAYRNLGANTFGQTTFNFGPWVEASGGWGDYDNDGALDLILMGFKTTGSPLTMSSLYHNDGGKSNSVPTAPPGLSVQIVGHLAVLSWDAASDAEQSGALSYNVRLGTAPGSGNVVGSMAAPTGRRLLPQFGNAGYHLSLTVTNLATGTYFWSVQAIDNSFAGSAFTPEQTFTLAAPSITNGPSSQTVTAGGTTLFTVAADGTPALFYQWRFQGSNIVSATNNSLTLTNVQATQEGSYSVVVSNAFGVTISTNVTLTVLVPPAFAPQTPQATAILAGTTLNLTGAATGTEPIQYQWFFNNVAVTNNVRINGANSNTLTINYAEGADAGDYWLVASNAAGVATNGVTTVNVGFSPSIVSQPTNETRTVGDTAIFEVTVNGTHPMSYQWRFGGTNIAGATNSVLTLANTQLTLQGSYSVLVTNAFGSTTSSNATLTILVPPTFTSQPQDQTNATGHTIVLSAAVTGTQPISYQWFFNNSPLLNNSQVSGANGETLSISNAQISNSGAYALVVSNAAGVATSSVAYVSITLQAATFTQQPQDQNTAVGSNSVFFVSVTGSLPITYQWFFNDLPLTNDSHFSGVTNASLLITAAQTNDIGGYFVVCANEAGSVTSSVANLNVGNLPVITVAPGNQTNIPGATVAFSVEAESSVPISYQWSFNGNVIQDATNATLTLSNITVSNAGTYSVMVSNVFGVTFTSATLSFYQRPAFTLQPASRSVVPGMSVNFTADVTSALPVSLQWQFKGVDIQNATNSSYSIASVNANHLGSYRLVATNIAGMTFSANALLTFSEVIGWGRNDSGQTNVPPNLTNVIAVAAGGRGTFAGHSLALLQDGSVVGWGYNNLGQATPPALTDAVAIAAGGDFSMALRKNGTVVVWGNGTQQNMPGGLINIISIAAGGAHCLALRYDGAVITWGSNQYGITNIPYSPEKISALAGGYLHTLALREDGSVIAWGLNSFGQGVSPAPFANLTAIASGNYHNVGLRADGTACAWGYGSFGLSNVPPSLTNTALLSVTAGDSFSAALRNNGTVFAWGLNDWGQTNIPSIATNAVAISGGAAHMLALVSDGHPIITRPPVGGSSFIGRDFTFRASVLGKGPLHYQWLVSDVKVANATNATLTLTNLTAARAGFYRLTVSNDFGVATSLAVPLSVVSNARPSFLTSLPNSVTNYQGSKFRLWMSVDGSGPLKYQWKLNNTNILGATNDQLVFDPMLLSHAGNYSLAVTNQFGTASTSLTNPPFGNFSTQRVQTVRFWGYQPVEPPATASNAVAYASGNGFYLALLPSGAVVGWGTSFYGETNPPASISNSVTTAIAAGVSHSLALRSDGIPIGWGNSGFGQTNVPKSATNVTAIACGRYHDLALRSDGTLISWGQNNNLVTNIPNSATNIVAIACGAYHSLALRENGSVVSWGDNSFVPANATNIIAIAAGYSASLALRTDGTLLAWGSNTYGQTNIPPGLSNVVAIGASAGGHFTALRSDGSVVYWGSYLTLNTSGTVVSPTDLLNVSQIFDGLDRSIALLGTRAPALTLQPRSRTVLVGTDVVLVGKASAAQPASYQWLKNGLAVVGATNDVLSLSKSQVAQSGSYQLIVSNSYGVAISKPASLNVSIALQTALDTQGLSWTSTGPTPWFGQTNTSHDNIDAARSGSITDGQETILQTSFTQQSSGQVSFWWKISSETGFDTLEFRINGILQASISGEVDWQQRTFPITSSNTLQFRYSKDANSSLGQDAAWVDQVLLLPNPPVITRAPLSVTAQAGTTVQFSPLVTGTGLSYQWWKEGTNPVGGNSQFLTLTNIGRAHRGLYSVTVANSGGSVTSSNALLTVIVPQRLGAATLRADGSFQVASRDLNGGVLTTAELENMELQVTSDLTNWTTLPNALTLTNGTLLLIDTNQLDKRFYRILEH